VKPITPAVIFSLEFILAMHKMELSRLVLP
jgi:hypothetical protein